MGQAVFKCLIRAGKSPKECKISQFSGSSICTRVVFSESLWIMLKISTKPASCIIQWPTEPGALILVQQSQSAANTQLKAGGTSALLSSPLLCMGTSSSPHYLENLKELIWLKTSLAKERNGSSSEILLSRTDSISPWTKSSSKTKERDRTAWLSVDGSSKAEDRIPAAQIQFYFSCCSQTALKDLQNCNWAK